MRVQFVSDLHLEFPASGGTLPLENVDNATDLLVLAGDICVARRAKDFRPFFQHCADTFPRVVYIAGNHEFYHGDIDEAHDQLREATTPYANLTYLDRETIDLDSHLVFSATLWTDCNNGDPLTYNALRYGMNDYRFIQWKARQHWKLQPEDTAEIHANTMAVLDKTMRAATKPVIVISHHAPSRRSTHPRYAQDRELNGGYSTDLENFLAAWHSRLPLWIHGHTHDSFDYDAQGVRVVCNPRGYVTNFYKDAENPNFDPRRVIVLETHSQEAADAAP